MNPEMQKQIDDHIKRVVDQVHDSYRGITSDLAKQVADSKLDVMALSQQNAMLQQQAEATSNQLKETTTELEATKDELTALKEASEGVFGTPDDVEEDGDSN